MAKIYSSTMDLKAIFRSTAKAPLDNRQVVQSVDDLTTAATWEGFAYNGMLVIVASTGDAYILKDASKVTTASSWIKLASDSSAAAAASVVQAGQGMTDYLSIDETTAQDGHKIYTVSLLTVDPDDATALNTGLADAYEVKSYVDGEIGGAVLALNATIEENEEVVSAALNDLDGRLSSAITGAAVTITESTPGSGVAKRYAFAQGGVSLGNVDIPADMVVESGSVVNITYSNGHYYDGSTIVDDKIDISSSQTPGDLVGKYIKLVIANSSQDTLYIAAKDLVDIYTSGSTDASDVKIIINNNQITAEIGSSSSLQTELTRLSGVETGAEVNIIETVKVNGTALTPANRAVDVTVPTALTDLTNDGNFVQDASYVHTDNNYTSAEKTKLEGIATGAQANVIETVKVNGSALTPDANKAVDVTVPTTLSALTNDGNFVQDASYVHTDNNYTTTEKTKLAGIAEGAEVNAISTISIDGTPLTITNKGVNITTLASKSDLEEVEHVTSAALNDLNGRLVVVEAAMPTHCANSYLSAAITSGSNTTITAATHGCGTFPLVQVYLGNEVVTANISVDTTAYGDVTVAWEITPSAQTPIRVRIVG